MEGGLQGEGVEDVQLLIYTLSGCSSHFLCLVVVAVLEVEEVWGYFREDKGELSASVLVPLVLASIHENAFSTGYMAFGLLLFRVSVKIAVKSDFVACSELDHQIFHMVDSWGQKLKNKKTRGFLLGLSFANDG